MKKKRVLIQRLMSIPLTLLLILAVYGLKIPNPMIILIILVVYFTYSDGYVSGILSGITSIIYANYYFLIKVGDPAGVYKAGTIVLAVTAIILLVGKLKAREQKNVTELQRNKETLTHLAMTDELTGASNRHAFFELANAIYDNGRRLGHPIAMLFIDIDYFKRINDRYGHAFGDAVLARLSETLRSCLRSDDVNCRYGGEEFLILLANADGDVAQLIANRIMEQVRAMRFEEYPEFSFTVSIGVSSMIPTESLDIDGLIRSADHAMYQAKQAGRNQIIVEHSKTGEATRCRTLRSCFPAAANDGNGCTSVAESHLVQDNLLQALDQTLELVYVADIETYELLYINSAGREKYGVDNLPGGKCYQLLQGLDVPCSFCVNDRLSYDSVYTWEFTNPMLSRHFLLRGKLVYWSGRKACVQIVTDITEIEGTQSTRQTQLDSWR